ncbi:MAG TPA: hypothetical protein DGG95_02320 [Cytophagales bacterium]|jgi:hypothetical protein|nr:hypothetical protein [Cytophagales bacterium]
MRFRIKLASFSFVFLLCGAQSSFGQFSTLHQAERKMNQRNWPEAYQLLTKVLRKDSIHVQAELLLCRWYLSRANPAHQTDSAHRYIRLATTHFKQLIGRPKEKLIRDQIDSVYLLSIHETTDSTAFVEAKQVNTEQGYEEFLKKYNDARQKNAALELRDEVAYLEALKQNSYQAFEKYVQKYPNSHRAKEARSRYEKLLFEFKTHDRKLKSFQAFVKEFPLSPYVREADRNIFEVLTSSGSPSDFIEFINACPKSHYVKEAQDILFHLYREMEEPMPTEFLSDSLKLVTALNRKLWAPFYKNGKFGFMNTEGTETLSERFSIIDEYYKCGSIADDILFTDAGLVSRSGKILSEAKSYKDLSYGFLKLSDSSYVRVMHKSGRIILGECLEDAAVLQGRFLQTRKRGKWGLISLSGRTILSHEWNSIDVIEDVLVLDRLGKKNLVLLNKIPELANGSSLTENFVFDEVSRIDKQRLLVRNGSLEGIVNSKLEFVVPLAIQQLQFTPIGLVRKMNDQFVFSDIPELQSKTWAKYFFKKQWLYLEDESGKKLFDTYAKKIIEDHLDSLWFENGLAFARLKDSIHVHINSAAHLSLMKNLKIHFIKASDSIRFFYIDQKKGKQVFVVGTGEKLFTTDANQIESIDANHFIITKKNKKGVVNLQGKIILPVEYDAIVSNGNKLSLFKDKKFGQYDLQTKVLIKPSFEKNIIPLGNLLITSRGGYLGLIDETGKSITNFEFEELIPWSENQVWAKRDFEWSLVNFRTQQKIIAHIKSIQLIKKSSTENIAVIKQENLYGVVNTTKGVIIPPNFSFIMNLGSEEEPLYFTTKEVEEAGIVVVIYYDKSGKFIRKLVYEDEDYARIVCPQD